ncbi:MAG: thioredoxin [Chitinivibrionales bacterium]|nr:thioredoxin [Chitinivibrionales bacterium]
MANENVREFTDQNFKTEALSAALPVVVDFWAVWCGPCKMLTPIFDELAAEFAGKIIMGKVNVDDNPQVASQYGVNSIPTLLFIKGGSVSDQQVGLLSKKNLKEKLERLIA